MAGRNDASRHRDPLPVQLDLSLQDRFTRGQRRAVGAAEVVAQVAGATAAILRHGLEDLSKLVAYELGAVVVVALLVLTVTLVLRWHASLARETFAERYRVRLFLYSTWLGLSAALLLFGPARLGFYGVTRIEGFLAWSDLVILLRATAATIGLIRGMSTRGFSPALLLVGSFLAFTLVGTLLLLLPASRADEVNHERWQDRLRIAAFTATSACCVNGLVVVPTGGPDAYWSRTGQLLILCMFQIGGLGIMTCGALFALTTGRSLLLRETATLRELFDSEQPVNLPRLLLAILAFTFGSELIGAILMSGLWADLPPGERAFYSLFHSVSAFCNAGFDLTGQSFLGWGERWQIWGVAAPLIILGGLGFGVTYNVFNALGDRLRRRTAGERRPIAPLGQRLVSGRPTRLTVTTRLVFLVTTVLLVAGTAWIFFFEGMRGGIGEGRPLGQRLADAWFQSVTYRSGGFSTVDLGELRTTSKLFAIVLMFVGGAPVSCAGGVKVTAVAIAVLAMTAIMRGRPHAEVYGRAIPDEVVKRALSVIAIGVVVVTIVAMLLTAFEAEGRFDIADLLFEAASACGTTGASTGVTSQLSPASQEVLIVAMFLGRIGPLTLLLSLAGRRQAIEYDYPEERVTLG